MATSQTPRDFYWQNADAINALNFTLSYGDAGNIGLEYEYVDDTIYIIQEQDYYRVESLEDDSQIMYEIESLDELMGILEYLSELYGEMEMYDQE